MLPGSRHGGFARFEEGSLLVECQPVPRSQSQAPAQPYRNGDLPFAGKRCDHYLKVRNIFLSVKARAKKWKAVVEWREA